MFQFRALAALLSPYLTGSFGSWWQNQVETFDLENASWLQEFIYEFD